MCPGGSSRRVRVNDDLLAVVPGRLHVTLAFIVDLGYELVSGLHSSAEHALVDILLGASGTPFSQHNLRRLELAAGVARATPIFLVLGVAAKVG